VALDALGREEVERADEVAGLGDAAELPVVARRRQPEVREIGPTRAIEQHVRRLHVAVHEPERVRGLETGRDLRQDAGGARRRERSRREQGVEARAVDQVHREKQPTAGVAGLVDANHVRVPDGGGEPGLPAEPRAELLVVGERGGHHLQRDLALGGERPGAVHDAHAATADDAVDAVAGELRARLEARRAHRAATRRSRRPVVTGRRSHRRAAASRPPARPAGGSRWRGFSHDPSW